ncbi:MAG: hypothetical protein JWR41_2530, partial [Modestobacter sp.]|nr:hypothetical protein [Modestobacter sp.]
GAVIFGMYATVEQPGEISLGDPVELADAEPLADADTHSDAQQA